MPKSKYYQKNKKKNLDYSREWRKNNPGRMSELYKIWAEKNPNKIKNYKGKFYEKNKDYVNERQKENNKILFEKVLDHYGHQCSIPECSNTEDLCIDHINGENVDYKYRYGSKLWRWIIKNNFPSGFRILCHYCNILDGYLRKHPKLKINGIDDLIKRCFKNER